MLAYIVLDDFELSELAPISVLNTTSKSIYACSNVLNITLHQFDVVNSKDYFRRGITQNSS